MSRSRRTFVLIHGAWHGAWCWQRVADRLEAQGHRVLAPTLSGVCERSHLAKFDIDLTTHVMDVVNEIRWKDLDDFVLVGHSYAGAVITGAAEHLRGRLAAIAYLDGFLPLDGESIGDMLGDRAPPWTERLAAPITAEGFRVNAADIAYVNAKMTSQPAACFTERLRLTGANQAIARKLYVRAPAFDNPPFDVALARCRADPTWSTATLPGGHDVMLDEPAKTAALLERLC